MKRFMIATMVLAGLSTAVYAGPAHAGCKITVKAQYRKATKDPVTGKRVDKITLDLVESDVRANPGSWRKMQSMCNPSQPAVNFGGYVSTTCELELECGKRQFRFESYYYDRNGNKQIGAIAYAPAPDEWKDLDTSTVVDVGELGTKFAD